MAPRNGFARHSLTHLALERLRLLALGEEVSYDEMQQLIGLDPRGQGDGYHYVKAARDILRRARIIIYPNKEAQSLRRWTDQEIAAQEEVLRNRRIRRQAKLGEQGLQAANLANLTAEEARNVTAGLGHMGAVQAFTGVRFTEARNQGLAANGDPPPPAPPPVQE